MLYVIIISAILVILLAVLFLMQSNSSLIEKAEELLAQKKYQEALLLIDPEKYKGGDDPMPFYIRARCYEELNDPIKALESFIVIQGMAKYPPDTDSLEIHKKIAYYTRLTQDDESAFEAYLNVLHVNPNDAETQRELGIMAINSCEFFIAAHFLEKAFKLKIEDPELLRGYAIALFETGRETQAFEIAARLVALEPANYNYNLLFISLCQSSHFTEAKRKIKEILPYSKDEDEKAWLTRFFYK